MSDAKRRLNVLVTRPRGEADIFAVTLAMRGYDSLAAPLLDIVVDQSAPLDLSDVQALLFTSANGVRAFAHAQPRRDIQAFCVGDATAAAARNAGFGKVESASGDVDTLAELVRARLKPDGGALVHAAGTAVAGDLAGVLTGHGFEVRRAQLYRAEAAVHLPFDVVAALRDGRVDVVTFFSPRTAEIFARLARDAGLEESLGRVTALALAPSALDILNDEGCRFARTLAAAQPNEAALLEALDKIAAETAPEPMAAAPASPAAETPKPPPPPPSSPPQAAKTRGLLVPVATALVVGVLGALGWAYWQSTLTAPAALPVAATRALEQRMTAIDRRLAQIESRPAAAADAAASAPAVDLAPIAARVAELESRPQIDAATQSALAGLMAENRRLAGDVSRLQAEIDRLQGSFVEQNADRASAKRAELRLAAGQLRDALMAGRPYAADLALVRELAGGGRTAAEFAALSRGADKGIESRASLARRFPPVANAVVAAARAGELPGRWAEILERAQGLLSIRRVGDVPGDSPAARVARAEARLAVDDLAGAVAAFEGVQAAPWAAPARDWLDAAQLRLAAEREAAALAASGGG